MSFHPLYRPFRFTLLAFNCLMTFGIYFSFDMPSVLQAQFQGNASCTSNQSFATNNTCCDNCLGLSPDNFNLLFAVWSWTGAAMVLFSGYSIDKIGNRAGAMIYGTIAMAASVLFYLASLDFVRDTSAMFPMLLAARILFGAAGGSTRIVQDRITAFWFKDKELAMAFGATVASSRLGSVVNFLVTDTIALKFGLSWALFTGTALCLLGLLSTAVVITLDAYGTKQLGVTLDIKAESKQMKISDIRKFGCRFWLLVCSIMFYYSSVLPFVADASLFFQNKYEYAPSAAGHVAGAVYYVSVPLSPILGYIIDVKGGRGYVSFLSALLTWPVFVLLALVDIPPLVCTIWLGVLYTLAAIGMWSSIPYLIPRKYLGTALGIVTCAQSLGMGITNLIIGQILGTNSTKVDDLQRWKYVMIPLAVNALVASGITLALNIIDRKQEGNFNKQGLHQDATLKGSPIDEETKPLLDNRRQGQVN